MTQNILKLKNLSNEDLETAKDKLKEEQKSVDEIINIFAEWKYKYKYIGPYQRSVKDTIESSKRIDKQ